MLQTNWWTCRQSLSAAVLPTKNVCTGSPDRQNSADKLCLHKIRQNLAKMQTNPADKLCLQKIRRNLAKMQTNPADKLCLQKIRRKLGQNADKSCRQTLSRLKIAGSCRKV
jgi:hypothetical protein